MSKDEAVLDDVENAQTKQEVLDALEEYRNDVVTPQAQAVVVAAGNKLHEMMDQ